MWRERERMKTKVWGEGGTDHWLFWVVFFFLCLLLNLETPFEYLFFWLLGCVFCATTKWASIKLNFYFNLFLIFSVLVTLEWRHYACYSHSLQCETDEKVKKNRCLEGSFYHETLEKKVYRKLYHMAQYEKATLYIHGHGWIFFHPSIAFHINYLNFLLLNPF